MKLYLSSYRVPNFEALRKLVGRPEQQTKVAIIPNAKDYYSDRVRNLKAKESLIYFLELGFNPEIVDLLDYRSSNKLEAKLKNYDMIWASGGNTFCLRYEMQRSGFDEIIRNLLKMGIVYAGESAGAIVAGISLEDIESADNPEFSEGIVFEGLGLTDDYILPHVGNPYFESSNQLVINKRKNDSNFVQLTDDQALIVNGKTKVIVDSLA